MKRKLFSAILFGALLTASTSGLTSCKDYDDDISNLQSQIDKLATAEQLSAKVTELQGQIEKAKADAVSAADAAKKVGEAAQKSADNAASAAEAAKKAAEDIAASAATKDDLKAAADAAQKAVEAIQSEVAGKTSPEDVKAAIDAALADVLAEVEEHHNAILELDEELNGEGGIAERLAAAEQAIEEGAAEVDLAPVKKLIEDFEKKAQEILGTAFKMVTSVSLYTNTGAGAYLNLPDTDLKFWQVKELADLTFPKDGETGEEKFTYTKDNVRLFDDKLLVRVSPVDATLTPDMISLINSQGAEVSKDVVEITSVEPFNQLLTKSTSNNGLWTVNFKVKDNKQDDLNAVALTKVNNVDKQVLFAVAVNNTLDVADTRRVISEYDVTIQAKDPKPYKFDSNNIYIKDTKLADIHNRIDQTEQGQTITGLKEYTWQSDPALSVITDGSDKNVVEAAAPSTGDYRQGKRILVVNVNEVIGISFTKPDKPIRGFYVTTDYKRAVESGNSEINAWNSYKYENVGTFKNDGTQLVPAKLQEGNYGYIKVLDLANMALVGDVIGFRVFAINLDGTLVDPDGFAFYVGIGAGSVADAKELPETSATIKYNNTEILGSSFNAEKNASALVDATAAFGVDYDRIAWSCSKQHNDNNVIPLEGTDFDIYYLQNNGSYLSGSANRTNKFRVLVKNPVKFEDGATSTLTAKLYKTVGSAGTSGEYLVRTVTLPFKKVMPTEVPQNVTYNALQNKYLLMSNTLTEMQMTAALDGNKNNPSTVNGKIDLTKFLVYADPNNTKIGDMTYQTDYEYLLGTSKWNSSNNSYTDEETVSTPFTRTAIPAALIDSKTEHSIRAKYTYRNISKRWDNNANAWNASNDLTLKANQEPVVIYCSWSYLNPDFLNVAFLKQKKETVRGGVVTKTDYESANQIQWAANTASATSPATVTGAFTWNEIKVKFGIKSKLTGLTSTSMKDLIDNKYLKIADAYTVCNGVKNAYIRPIISGDDITGFQQIANKTVDHNEEIVIEIVDCYNFHQTITLPIQIKSSIDNTLSGYPDGDATWN